MEELKLLLEMGPNLTEGAVRAFGLYVVSKMFSSIVVGLVAFSAIFAFYKGFMADLKSKEGVYVEQ